MRWRSQQTDPPALDWERISNGKPWRLRRGQDFEGHPKSFAREVQKVAKVLGRAARVARDRMDPDDYLWIQFADSAITVGDPCPCGGRVLRRKHPHFVQCETCGSHLILEPRRVDAEVDWSDDSPADSTVADDTADEGLAAYTMVRLTRYSERADRAGYVGFGFDAAGTHLLLVVDEPRVDGDPVRDPVSPTGYVHRVTAAIPAELVEKASDRAADWDVTVG